VRAMRSAAAAVRDERGVYKAAHRYHDGNEYLYAVRRDGTRLKKIVVLLPGVSEPRAVAWLEQLLDREDPPGPRLVVAAPTVVTPQPKPPEFIEHAITAALRRAKKVARRRPFTLLREDPYGL
jgi:hypothetical protein